MLTLSEDEPTENVCSECTPFYGYEIKVIRKIKYMKNFEIILDSAKFSWIKDQ